MIKQLTIFGVGLIGGSLGLALKKAGYCQNIVGCGRNESHLQQAVELGAIDRFTLSAADAVSEADVVFLAVPMGAMKAILDNIKDHVSKRTIITDGGSSKASVVEAATKVFGSLPPRFVPAHPIAGRETSGVAAALADLFVDHKVILTPVEDTDAQAIESVTSMWQATGARVEFLGVQQHDRVLAATSHLPHVLAYALVNTLSQTAYVDEIFEFAAGGFRDFSRIASSDPTMWRDICLENRDAILENLAGFQRNLEHIRGLIDNRDGQAIFELFKSAKAVRDNHVCPKTKKA